MKRSNRLVILVGVLLAVLAFVAIVILLNQGGGGGTAEPSAPATVPVLVANEDIDRGEDVTPDKVRVEQVPPDGVVGTALTATSQAQGQPSLFQIPQDSQVSAEALGLVGGGGIDISAQLDPGEKAIAFQVDRVTGEDFLITAGDTIDILLTQQITVLQETADSAANPDENAPQRFEPVTGLEDQRTVKAILQDKRVIYVSQNKAQPLEPTEDTNGDGVINDDDAPPQQTIDSVIIIFAGTDQDAEVIKFAQNALGEQGALTAVVRNDDDDEIETTTGITIDSLVTDYGLKLPEIVQQLNEEAAP